MEQLAHIILRLRDEANKNHLAASERAEQARREADRYAVEVAAYEKALALVNKPESEPAKASLSIQKTSEILVSASEKWVRIYRALYEAATPPYTYDDLEAAASLAGYDATKGGQRTQMMNAVRSGWFERVGHGKFEFTESGLALVGAKTKKNEPPSGGSEAGEAPPSPKLTEQNTLEDLLGPRP